MRGKWMALRVWAISAAGLAVMLLAGCGAHFHN